VVTEGPKNKYERLENRISMLKPERQGSQLTMPTDELETLLRQKDNALLHGSRHQNDDKLMSSGATSLSLATGFGDSMAGMNLLTYKTLPSHLV
jgi:hypothetical protein